jgi:hypothetical protein
LVPSVRVHSTLTIADISLELCSSCAGVFLPLTLVFLIAGISVFDSAGVEGIWLAGSMFTPRSVFCDRAVSRLENFGRSR